MASNHPLARNSRLTWSSLAGENILIQGTDDEYDQRQFFSSLIGSRAQFQTHDASNQTVFALVAAGFGIALAAAGQAHARLPGIIFRPLREANACFRMYLAWMPDAEEPAIGRFVAFVRDEVQSRGFS
jgi:DNA-binding transcriptional LysR family regulator